MDHNKKQNKTQPCIFGKVHRIKWNSDIMRKQHERVLKMKSKMRPQFSIPSQFCRNLSVILQKQVLLKCYCHCYRHHCRRYHFRQITNILEQRLQRNTLRGERMLLKILWHLRMKNKSALKSETERFSWKKSNSKKNQEYLLRGNENITTFKKPRNRQFIITLTN